MKRILLLSLMLILFVTPSTFASDGNVYENQEYKFRITLPDNWEIIDDKNYLLHAISTSASKQHFALMGGTINPDVGVNEYETKIVTPYMEWVLRHHPNYLIKDKRHIVINNHNAMRVIVDEDEKYYDVFYFFRVKDNFFFAVAVGLSNYYDADQENIDQILSTFTLLN